MPKLFLLLPCCFCCCLAAATLLLLWRLSLIVAPCCLAFDSSFFFCHCNHRCGLLFLSSWTYRCCRLSVFLVADYFVVIVIFVVVADYFNHVIVVFFVVAWFDFADQSICSAQTFLPIIFRKGWYFSLLNFSLNLSLHLFFCLLPTLTELPMRLSGRLDWTPLRRRR